MNIEGWEKTKISQFGEIVTGSTPDTQNSDYWDGDIPFVSPSDFNSSAFVLKTDKTLTSQGAKQARNISENSILVTCIGSIGGIAIAPWKCVTNQQINSVICRENFDALFIYFIIKNNLCKLQALAGTTTLPIINKSTFGNIEIVCPKSKSEQTQIAAVLSTIDRAIAQTEAIIAKQQRIKTGLMQDLLTKGIDENGNIRSEDTHQFKDSAIGRIPVEWELSNLIDVLSLTPKNGIYKPANQIGQGVLLIGQTSFTKDRLLNYELARRASVTSSELQAYQLEEEDILISRVFATVEGVGLPTFVSNLPEASVYESNMLRLRIDNQISLPKLVFYWLNSEQIRKYIIASVNASNQTSINQKTLNALPIPVPPKNEQIKLLKILEKNISCLIEEKASYHKQSILKTGLMQDLLTGKVRVTNLLQEKAAAN